MVWMKVPYTNFHNLNQDWIVHKMMEFEEYMDHIVQISVIKYADPIQWRITGQYEQATVVIDAETGIAYISVQPVPAGVAITNTDYWTPVFDLQQILGDINERIATETGERTAADDALEDLINANTTAISAETTAREAAITAETAAREAADTNLTNAVGTLNTRIDSVVNNNIINVKNYGAVGDGTTDDTAAIQAAVNAAGTYGQTFIPAGHYKTTTTITMPAGGRLTGAGEYITILEASTSGQNVITSTEEKIEISELSIYGNGYARDGIHNTGAWLNVHNVWIQSCSNAAIYLEQDNHLLSNIHTRDSKYGILLHDHCVNNTITACEIWANDACIQIDRHTTQKVEGLQIANTILAWAKRGINILGEFLQIDLVNTIIGQYSETGIYVETTATGSRGLFISNSYLGGQPGLAGTRGMVIADGLSRLSISNTYFHLNTNGDILALAASGNDNNDFTLSGCTFDSAMNMQHIKGCFVHNNRMTPRAEGMAFVFQYCTGALTYNRITGTYTIASTSTMADTGNIRA